MTIKLSFKTLGGMVINGKAFLVFSAFRDLLTVSRDTGLKENSPSIVTFSLIFKMLGCTSNSLMASRTFPWETSTLVKRTSFSDKPRDFTALSKKSLKVWAISAILRKHGKVSKKL